MLTMIKLIFFIAILLFSSPAIAQDYVARALTICAPLEGRIDHSDCVSDNAKRICSGLPSKYDQKACHEDFAQYFHAEVRRIDARKKESADNTQRLIEQLQRGVQ